MSILGNPVVRREDERFLTGASTYVADLVPGDAAHLVYVRSYAAHGRIEGIDVDEAIAAPGVIGVFTADDLAELGRAANFNPAMLPDAMRRPYLAIDTVRYVGEPIVAVVASSYTAAVDAAEMVFVDIEPLPAVIDLEHAASDDVVLFPEYGTNTVVTLAGDDADFSDCEVVVEERIVNQRLTAAPMEPRSGTAWWDGDGRLVHHSACQGAHPTRDALAAMYGLDPDRVRVVVPDMGGGFGAKSRTYPEELVLGWYARAIGRPVTWTETRTENVQAMPHGRGQLQFAKLGGTRDGVITAYQLDVLQDAGAYPLIGALLSGMTKRMLTGTYAIDNAGFSATSLATSMSSIAAYRGAGRPEATVAIERMIDRFAAEIGMDPAEVRFKNLLPRFTEPHTTAVGTVYDVGDYPEALRLALDAVGYDDLRGEQARRRASVDAGNDHRLLGIGVATYVEITAGAGGSEYGSVELEPGGRLRVVTGTTAFGQGHETTWAMLVSDRTGVPIDRISVVSGDTDLVPRGGLTVGSRSVQLGGAALAAATAELVDRARAEAARFLEASPDDVVLDADRGEFHVVGTPARSIGWGRVAAESAGGPLTGSHDFAAPNPTFPCGAHVAVVEVDVETGATEVLRLVGVDDAGTIINPLLFDGQVHGGMAQGVAQALLEEIVYDDDGNLLTSNFMDYGVISATEVPSFELVHLETPTWANELGAKGVGESGTIGAIPAVYNAVIDALAHRGVRHLTTPLTKQKVWEAVRAAES